MKKGYGECVQKRAEADHYSKLKKFSLLYGKGEGVENDVIIWAMEW